MTIDLTTAKSGYDYKTTAQELMMALTEDSGSRWAAFCRENYPTIKHALAMMQKLEEPSKDMLDAFCNTTNGFGSVAGCKAMLEQAEKEIAE